jgi:hypothetical protein
MTPRKKGSVAWIEIPASPVRQFQNVNEPTGWVNLKVDTADPKLHNELDGFISNLERIAVRESELVD